MPPAEFEPEIPGSERHSTSYLDRASTVIGRHNGAGWMWFMTDPASVGYNNVKWLTKKTHLTEESD